MDDIEAVRRILGHRGRQDLADLLAGAHLDIDVSDKYWNDSYTPLTIAFIYCSLVNYEVLKGLPDKDKTIIFDGVSEVRASLKRAEVIDDVEFRIDPKTLLSGFRDDKDLLADVQAQRDLMICVATGGPSIKSVNAEYRTRQSRIRAALEERGLDDPNQFEDLWAWHEMWSSGDLPTYRSRREYVAELYRGLINTLDLKDKAARMASLDGVTGWEKVDRCIKEIRRRLKEARHEEHFQVVGTLCRETLISLANAVYDLALHGSPDGVEPSQTDAKRRLDAYLATELAGSSNEAARKHAKAALELANDLQHSRTADFRHAALCAEATTSVANLISIIAGQRRK